VAVTAILIVLGTISGAAQKITGGMARVAKVAKKFIPKNRKGGGHEKVWVFSFQLKK